MSIIAMKCPSCGADIELDKDREYGFCSYCGTKIQNGERVNVHVTHEYPDGAPNINNVTINEVNKTAPSIVVKKPKAARMVWGIILITLSAMFVYVTIDEQNMTGWFLTVPCLVGGILLIVFYCLALKNYNSIISKAAESGNITNKD